MELKDGELPVGELVDRLDVSQSSVSKQLFLLHGQGLLNRRKEGTQVFYSIGDQIIYTLCSEVCNKLNRDVANSAELLYHI